MTKQTQHTPGPWHVQPIGSQRYIEAQGPKFICDMQADEAADERDIGEMQANAKLICAAPDLLAAAKCLAALHISQCDRCDGTGKEPKDETSACRDCGGPGELVSYAHPQDVKDARAAITKSTA